MEHAQLNLILEQIRNPNKKNWILMVPNSLGETLVVCGLAKSFIEKHGYGITLVIPQSHAFIPECFPNTFDRVVYLHLEVIRQFSQTGYIPQNLFCIEFPINTWPKQNGDGRTYELYERWINSLGCAGLNFLDLYRYILRLDWSSKFTFLKIPSKSYDDANKIIANLNIKRNKTVVFFVGNNTNKPAPAYLWAQVAKLYFDKGYEVIINKYGAMLLPDDLSIPGAKIVDITLDVSVPICEYAGNVVSGSSGFVNLALAANINCNMNIFLPNEMCYDYNNFLYKDINFMSGCSQLATPELTCNAKNFREWIVPKQHDSMIFDEIAHGIVFDINNQHTITSQC
jgi:hypothetical protein